MLILNESACATGLYDRSKSIPLIWELPFAQWRAEDFYAPEKSPSLILVAMSERMTSFPLGRDFIGTGAERRITSYSCHIEKRASFQNFL